MHRRLTEVTKGAATAKYTIMGDIIHLKRRVVRTIKKMGQKDRFLSTAYGVLHSIYGFTEKVERLLWKVSVFIVPHQ